MTQPFTFPGGQTTYVPTLHSDIIVEYTRNPAAFPITKYIQTRKVDKMRGYYIRMLNDNQGRYINEQDSIWADGNDAPELYTGNDEFTFPPFECVRHNYAKRLGYLSVEQSGGWDILSQ